jgi:DNA-binding transcriptional ArsR family regulator
MTTETQAPARTPKCCETIYEHLRHVIEGEDGREDRARMVAAFKALSDDTRLRILQALATAKTELCECDIVPLSGLSQPTISYHLKILREAGLVDCERRGQWAYHWVKPRALLGLVRDLTNMA